jgi:hypothetical protein
LWNGADPFLKERFFGLTGQQGNHGEDVKEYWWYLDATPTSSWLRWRYHYPQSAFPYEDLVTTNRARSREQPEYELLDTGVFDADRYWVVDVTWAKGSPEDLLWQITVTNAGPDPAVVDVLPTVWFRNTWSWDAGVPRPELRAHGPGSLAVEDGQVGEWRLAWTGGAEALFCENDTNSAHLWGQEGPPYPKDGIADHIIHGLPTVNPSRRGTKASVHHRLTVGPGASAEIRLRFWKPGEGSRPAPTAAEGDLGAAFTQVVAERAAEADEFYAGMTPTDASADEAAVLRQAAAGMMWSKQFFHLDLQRWLSGDPGQPRPPEGRGDIRNGDWTHLDNRDVISMPDPWEYPWYAAWDLAFHCVALAHLDPEFAKRQLVLLCREWYMHPNGQLPAYEWNFSDVNPPVHAWAALRVCDIDAAARAARGEPGDVDFAFLERVFHKLLLNFTWWVNRKDESGNNVFEGGFLGLDNIGLFDRSKSSPRAGPARAVGRHGLDGHVLPRPARDGATPGGPRRRLRRRGHEVLRALRVHRRRHGDAGVVGRAGRLLLRRAPPRRDAAHPGPGPVHGRRGADIRGDRPRARRAGPPPGVRPKARMVRGEQAGVRRAHLPHHGPGGEGSTSVEHRQPGSDLPHPGLPARSRRDAVRPRSAVFVPGLPRRAVLDGHCRHDGHHRL